MKAAYIKNRLGLRAVSGPIIRQAGGGRRRDDVYIYTLIPIFDQNAIYGL